MNIRLLEPRDVDLFDDSDSIKSHLATFIEANAINSRIGEDDDGNPVFACGLCILWEGVAEVWIRVFNESRCISIVRAAKKLLNGYAKTLGLHRIQATVRAGDERTLKFDKHLGFEYEATLKDFHSDQCDGLILRYKAGD